ncbi:MAG: glycosyltransferase family 4 protein [Demequinaceae bacterium]|nr:glycosyltransferase family 4 protein [Demequinaceae bacterium]
MAGPAIRAWKMAMALSREHEVRLVSLTRAESVDAPFETHVVRPGDDRLFRRFERWADIIVFQGHALEFFRSLRRSSKFVVADVYAPMYLERLEQSRKSSQRAWDAEVRYGTASVNEQLAGCDFFLCASERQRHLYLGQLAALGRVNVSTYSDDPLLTRLITVVPFGLDEEPPRHTHDVLRGVRKHINKDDKIILWSGGLYNWFDPKTLITAVAILATRRPKVRLFFMGTKHPNPGIPEMAIVSESRELAKRLGVEGTNVIFNDAWVDFDDRQNYLLEADVGVSTHYEHIETTFSFRTRILDYLWAGLPMVLTRGDALAELVEREGLGVAVPEQDPEALADALEKVLFDDNFSKHARRNIARVREGLSWGRTLEPLLEYARDPFHALDRARGTRRLHPRAIPRLRYGILRDIGKVWTHLRSRGIGEVFQRGWQTIRRRSGLERESRRSKA